MRQRLAALLPFAFAAAVVAFLLRRLRGGGGDTPTFEPASREPREDAGAPPSDSPATESVEKTYTCECGTEYRTSGEGRHTVYWKADSSISDPVIDGRCVECEKPLPGHHPVEADGDGESAAKAGDGDAKAEGDTTDREPSTEEAATGEASEAAAAGEREASS